MLGGKKEFGRELESMHLDLIRMGGMIEEAIDKSIYSLEKRDRELAGSIIENDKRIDDIERVIESQCLRLLLRQQPGEKEVRSISTAIKMVTDMERIGDHASDIAAETLRFGDHPFIKPLEHIPLMAHIASGMVKDAVDAFVREDLKAAREVIDRDDEVDKLFDTVKQDLTALIKLSNDNVDQSIDLLLIAKYLERIGDHAVNVAGWVIFYMTGERKNTKII
jgi:phosphate transport system protein